MKKKNLLTTLSALVGDCGYESVKRSLDELRPLPRPQNAVAVVASLDVNDEEKRRVLETLAEKYDAKQFMPNVKHVREFMDRVGRDSSRVKARQKVPVAVFQCLATWDTMRLQKMEQVGWYTPKSLTRIVTAIDKAERPSRS